MPEADAKTDALPVRIQNLPVLKLSMRIGCYGGLVLKRTAIAALITTLTLLCFWPSASDAQKKGTVRRRPLPTPTPMPTPDLRVEAGLVADQIKAYSRFIYIYGKVVNGFEVAEEQVRRGQMTTTAAARNRESKEALYRQVVNLRGALDAVVQKFQANPRLQVQYLRLSSAAEAALQAEQLAAATRWDEAGKTLTTVIERLADTMVSFRQ